MSKKALIFLFLSFLPFGFFISGYLTMHFVFQKRTIVTPNLIGKSVIKAIKMASDLHLGLHLVTEQEDPDLPEGIVINQTPYSGMKIRQNQNIFITISRRPKPVKVPNFLEKNYRFINSESLKIGASLKFFWLHSIYPSNSCIAQTLSPGVDLDDQTVIVYLSLGIDRLSILPNFKGCSIEQLKEICSQEGIELEIFPLDPDRQDFQEELVVLDQKPIPGSIVDLEKKLHLQVQVE